MQGADVALFYCSGHGMQVGGANWLVPVDANPANPRDMDVQIVDASLVLRQIDNAGTKLNLVILDACRNKPFASRGAHGRDADLLRDTTRQPGTGIFRVFNQVGGRVAPDGTRSGSAFG